MSVKRLSMRVWSRMQQLCLQEQQPEEVLPSKAGPQEPPAAGLRLREERAAERGAHRAAEAGSTDNGVQPQQQEQLALKLIRIRLSSI
jgi:hypothetical protein